MVTTIACGLGAGSDEIVMVNRLPTFTRTPLSPLPQAGDSTPVAVFQPEQPPPAAPIVENPTASLPAAPLPVVENTPSPAALDVPTPAGDSPAAALPAATPLSALPPQVSTTGWSFSATRVGADPYGDGLLLFGEAINNTGASQALSFISGTFYDNLGQVVAGEDNTDDYAPLEVVPPGGQIPFELTVYGLQNAENYELWASSEVSSQTPRQDFVVSDVEQLADEGDYCVAGVVRNQGEQLNEYLVIVATLYDAQNNVINFGDDYYSDVEDIIGDETRDFEICIESLEQTVARYQVAAWGQ